MVCSFNKLVIPLADYAIEAESIRFPANIELDIKKNISFNHWTSNFQKVLSVKCIFIRLFTAVKVNKNCIGENFSLTNTLDFKKRKFFSKSHRLFN